VARQNTQLAIGAVGDDEVDVALEQAALDTATRSGTGIYLRAPKPGF